MKTEEYTPVIPPWLRAAVFFAGVLVTAVAFIFPEADILVRIGLAIGFLASTFGVAYNPLRSRFASNVAKQTAVASVAVAALEQITPGATQVVLDVAEDSLDGQDEPDDPESDR